MPLAYVGLTPLVLYFTYFSHPLPEDPPPEILHQIYTSLLEQTLDSIKDFAKRLDDSKDSECASEKEFLISYNLALTDRAMVLCPRLSEGLEIKDSGGNVIGPISLNGTILGGTLLVKTEQEWDALRNDEENLKDVLQAIGIPTATNDQTWKL
jgi:sulfate adenylyltransferase (ADP) / ATP adenylyltransferase